MKKELYTQVFNNIVISKRIFGFVQRKTDDGYRSLDSFPLYIVFLNEKLFTLKYQSYKYYKNKIGNRKEALKKFKQIKEKNEFIGFFESKTIPSEIFIELYQDFKDIKEFNKLLKDPSVQNKILFYSIKSLDRKRIEFLIKDEHRFDYNIKSYYITEITNIMGSKIEYIKYIVDSIKKYSKNYGIIKSFKKEKDKVPLFTNEIWNVESFEVLKYLLKEKESFFSDLTISGEYMVKDACKKQNLEMLVFSIKQFNVKPNFNNYNMEYWRDTSFEIFKYLFETYTDLRFNDISFHSAYNGDLEYAKYIVEGYINKDPRILITYRSLDRVAEKGSFDLAEYFLSKVGHLEVSRDALNNSIKSGDLKLVNLFKNVPVTKKGENFTIYDSTYQYIKKNNRLDILNTLQNDCIYSSYFENFIIN
ncbi:hypothetical protein DICPUDRAFT_149476 [Dictyostelium purpureum]|uniref:Uncharacterized protein n=1 Tax=Dictyostelium purpureum TaxID=5786 RepID=F0ZDU6_DICPU|nr:uncharacterized protein DICPUDRAFT_149476 [Dictyostelium purpureum]XP_003288831.1 uncharacterized protein DICPUDRAFT_79613 [Dictyostelium purpureum]EGC34650.1 hypothetical protein DICPUDRAFT_79613 [Dictyostelium purpureum]EGC37840.1 hypothetical protein DICPUDRAFT_149476 [Dictyostelium purpureum]|eukprot:XP_003285590.1 hypothetical protein DICPUDRAFT_149476 [Dictyostelium purpureum]